MNPSTVEFVTFYNLLMSSAPNDYIPHLFVAEKHDKIPHTARGSWSLDKNRITAEQAIKLMRRGFNISIAGMPSDNLLIVDVDDESAIDLDTLVPTLSVRSNKYWGNTGEQNGMYGRCGEDSPNWKGGISPERQSFYASPEWAYVIKMVWKKDKARCVRCGAYKTDDIQMHIHHIITFAVEDMRCELDNLMLTCKKCHNWIHSKKNIYEYFIAHPIRGNLK